MRRNNKAQSALAYAVLIAAAVFAVMVMKLYLTQVVQEKYRQNADSWGEGEQFERGKTTPKYTTKNPWKNVKRDCPLVLVKEEALRKAIKNVEERIARRKQEIEQLTNWKVALEERKAEVEKEAQRLENRGFTEEANNLRNSIIPDLDKEIAYIVTEIGTRVAEVKKLEEELKRLKQELNLVRAENPQCF